MKRVLTALIRFYQNCISALFHPCCRFQPTCSQYALEAIALHGAMKGTLLALWRILRCNPFGGSGYDPVPERFTLRKRPAGTSGAAPGAAEPPAAP